MQHAIIQATDYSLRVEVGTLDGERFGFGMSTDILGHENFAGEFEVKINRSSVNDSPSAARTALESFEKAIEIAEFVESALEGDNGFVTVGVALMSSQVQEDLGYEVIKAASYARDSSL